MKIFECKQQSEEWFALRRGKPTCSSFGKILTGKGKLSTQADDYIYELIADMGERLPGDEEDVPSYTSRAMARGVRYEEEARRWYEFNHNLQVHRVGFVTTDCERFGGSPDALVGENGGLEIKCPQAKTHIEYWHKGILPNEYVPQVHGYLWITGRLWWDFVSYCPGYPPFRLRVQPDGYTEQLGKTLIDFYVRFQEILQKVRAA